jgi:hypothetical protein
MEEKYGYSISVDVNGLDEMQRELSIDKPGITLAEMRADRDGIQFRLNERIRLYEETCQEQRREIERLQIDAARYRWLRDGNAYYPEEQMVRGGAELDELIDDAIAEDEETDG